MNKFKVQCYMGKDLNSIGDFFLQEVFPNMTQAKRRAHKHIVSSKALTVIVIDEEGIVQIILQDLTKPPSSLHANIEQRLDYLREYEKYLSYDRQVALKQDICRLKELFKELQKENKE